MTKEYMFEEGSMHQPHQAIYILTDVYDDGPYRCRHVRELKKTDPEYRRPKWLDDDEEDETQDGDAFIVPRTVKAFNQGGFDCTYVCLDCILEAAKDVENGNAEEIL